jgi:hypothetical protein
VIQNKEIMEKARNDVKSRQPVEDFNLMYGIKEALGEDLAMTHELQSGGAFIQSTQHGIINRFSSGT